MTDNEHISDLNDPKLFLESQGWKTVQAPLDWQYEEVPSVDQLRQKDSLPNNVLQSAEILEARFLSYGLVYPPSWVNTENENQFDEAENDLFDLYTLGTENPDLMRHRLTDVFASNRLKVNALMDVAGYIALIADSPELEERTTKQVATINSTLIPVKQKTDSDIDISSKTIISKPVLNSNEPDGIGAYKSMTAKQKTQVVEQYSRAAQLTLMVLGGYEMSEDDLEKLTDLKNQIVDSYPEELSDTDAETVALCELYNKGMKIYKSEGIDLSELPLAYDLSQFPLDAREGLMVAIGAMEKFIQMPSVTDKFTSDHERDIWRMDKEAELRAKYGDKTADRFVTIFNNNRLKLGTVNAIWAIIYDFDQDYGTKTKADQLLLDVLEKIDEHYKPKDQEKENTPNTREGATEIAKAMAEFLKSIAAD